MKQNKLFKLWLLAVILLTGSGGMKSYALTAGDIAIIAVNADASKTMTFVALTDIPANTIITFTDNAWNATNQTWRNTEASIAWSNTSVTPKGTVVTVSMGGPTSPFTVNVGTITTNTTFNLAVAGDQVLAYEGTTAPTTNNSALWLYGFSLENWVYADNTNQSDLPAALNGASVAMTTSTTEVDNAYFANGSSTQKAVSVSGTKAELLALFTDASKYYKNDTDPLTIPDYSFTVNSGTTPNITVTVTDLSGFTYEVGSGPSATQSFSASGYNLTENISLTSPTDYEISTSESSGYSSSLTLTQNGGTVASTPIYVRLKAGLATGTYVGEEIIISSTDAETKKITLNGSVTPPVATIIIINEVDADTPGADAAEFIELYDGGVGNTSLDGLVVVLFNGNDDKSYAAFDLDGKTTDANGYFVIGSTGMGTDIEVSPGSSGWLQNGQDAVALYKGNATDFPNGTAVNNTNLFDALVYETNDNDGANLLVLLNSGQPQIDETGRGSSENHSMQRLPNGTGGARYTTTYDLTYPTPGAANVFKSVTWSGTTDQVWATATNWTTNLVPDRGVDVIIPNETNYPQIGANASANDITINPGAKLTLGATFALNVAGDFTIKSNENGTGTFVDLGTTTISGTTTVEQYLSGNRWWYVASPVSGAAISLGLNYYDASASPSAYNATATTMASGVGYAVKPTAETTITFTGTLKAGDVTVPVHYNGNTGDAFRGYNLIGNPYPSALNWNNVYADATNKTNIASTMWYRSNGAYQTYNASGTVGVPSAVDGYIPPMQAFWVRSAVAPTTATASNVNLLLNNTMRSHSTLGANPLRAPQRTAAAESNQILRLQVAGVNNTDETVLYFNSNAAMGFDTYDSPKLSGTGAEIYTLLNTQPIVINGMNEIPYNTEIALGFKPVTAGTFTFSAGEFSNFAATDKVILKDKLLNTETDLTLGSYTFTSDAVSTTSRFSVMFPKSGVPTGVDNEGMNGVNVYAKANRIVVATGEASQGSMIYVFNSVGERLAAQTVNGIVNEIGRTFPAGVYVVKVNNHTAKVIIR